MRFSSPQRVRTKFRMTPDRTPIAQGWSADFFAEHAKNIGGRGAGDAPGSVQEQNFGMMFGCGLAHGENGVEIAERLQA